MATHVSPNFNLAVTRLCDYLSTLPFNTAMRVWGLMPEDHELGDFATAILARLPAGFFNQTPTHLSSQRFVYENGKITIQASANACQKTPWPTPVAASSGSAARARLLAPTQRSMNSFMMFRCFMAPALPNIPQRSKSGAISGLWQLEASKGHWELLARAYTYLRNNYELKNTTLKSFMKEVAKMINLPNPEDYVRALGYELAKCDLPICVEGGVGSHYHLTNVPLGAQVTLQIKPFTMEEILKPFIYDPNNVLKVNSEPMEKVMTVARDMITTPFDSILNPGQVDDLELGWAFADIYGDADNSFSEDEYFNGDPLSDPIYTNMLRRDAWMQQICFGNPNDIFVPSGIALQANVQ